jgi:hypothetical protein
MEKFRVLLIVATIFAASEGSNLGHLLSASKLNLQRLDGLMLMQ